jgi:RNA polymerase sigma-70 factor (ECF subfamily)
METGTESVSLERLMQAAQAGDGTAYEHLLRSVVPVLRRQARAKWIGSIDPEDLVQDVLLSLHSVRHTYDPARPFLPWLSAIFRRRLVDLQRRHIRKAENEVTTDTLPETFSADETNWLEDGQGDPDLLKSAIASLPAGQRKAIELLKIQELSLKEAAERTGMSISALKVAVHRGMKSLKQTLGA